MTLYAESAADQTDHFANAFVRENVVYGYDVVMTYDVRKFFVKRNSAVTHLQFCTYGSWDSLFSISISPTANL